jgi:DNA polymerase-3 subunit epsilon
MYSRSRLDAVLRARKYLAAQPLFLDTETTGLNSIDEIIEICILDSGGRPLVDTLVKPSRPIPGDVIRIHGITNSMVKDAPTWPEVWTEVQAALKGRFVGIYNADFDVRMMAQSHRRHNMGWEDAYLQAFCIMKLYAEFYGTGRWQTLDAAGRQCHIRLPNAHRALADTLLARAVLLHMAGLE